MAMSPCSVSILTPLGRGAVATVAVIGPCATERVTRYFAPAAGRPLETFAQGRILFGRWESGGGHAAEEVVVFRRGEQRVEIHCHGGRASARAIVDALLRLGCEEVPWRQLVRDEESPLAADARIALAAARTERTAGILLDQYHGALQEALGDTVDLIQREDSPSASQRLQELLQLAPVGLHLTAPFRVVLAGPANVGKSSLINAILGYERAIVFDQPGTTRDVVSASTAVDGWPIELSDTAGLRDANHHVEAAGVRLAQAQMESADLLLLVFDASQPWDTNKQQLIERWPEALVIHNKCDLVRSDESSRPPGIPTSAVTGEGIEELTCCISAALVRTPPAAGTAVPFTQEHVAGLVSAAALLDNGQADLAIRELVRFLA